MGFLGGLFHQVVDGFGPESEPLPLEIAQVGGQGGGSGSKDVFRPFSHGLADVLLESRPAGGGEVALESAVIIAAAVQDNAVQVFVGGQFSHQGHHEILHFGVGWTQEAGSIAFGDVQAVRKAGGKVLNRAPVFLGVIGVHHSLGTQAVGAEVTAHQRVDGRMDLQSGCVAFFDEGLQVVEGGRALRPPVGTSFPAVYPLQGGRHAALEKDVSRGGTYIHDDVREAGLGNFPAVGLDVFPAVAVVIEVGGGVYPDIAGLGLGLFGRGVHRFFFASPAWVPRMVVILVAAPKDGEGKKKYERAFTHRLIQSAL